MTRESLRCSYRISKEAASRALLVFIAVCGLLAGALEYIGRRPPESVYFLRIFGRFKGFARIRPSLPPLYGSIGNWLPDFLHVFSFSLLFIALFSKSRISRGAYCFLWFAVNAVFEIGQKYGSAVIPHMPGWLDRLFVLENTKNYLLHGRFDMIDMLAMALGACAAFLLSELTIGGMADEKACKTLFDQGR